MPRSALFVIAALLCGTLGPERLFAQGDLQTIGSITRHDERLDELIDVDAPIDVLAAGFEWSEGPVWVGGQRCLLFSDVPKNVVHRWTAEDGVSVFLDPSGFTGTVGSTYESGSNGLALDDAGRLLLCQHGDRRVAMLDSPWDRPEPKYKTIAHRYDGKRFNSPNDLAVHSSGDVYFTDPPYGLNGQMDDPAKELEYQGVYRFDGESVHLLTDELTRPNGIAFSPDEKFAYVAVSDHAAPVWMRYPIQNDGNFGEGEVFFDAAGMPGKGSPDGLKVDQAGNLFATGPGGVLIISPDGDLLGLIAVPVATANCAFGDDGSTLFMTADMYLLRVKTKTVGCGF